MAFFMGRALWMVSVSVNGIPRVAWDSEIERLARRVATRALDGCGIPGDDRWSQGVLTTILRRQCSPAERRRVPEPYLPQAFACERE